MKKLLAIFLLLSCMIYGQSFTTTNSFWDRIRLGRTYDKFTIYGDCEFRHNLSTYKSINQFRLFIGTNDNVKFGQGLICQPEMHEFRTYQTVNWDIHQIQFEQRFYDTCTNLRVRYQILKTYDYGVDNLNSISLGAEPMIEGKFNRQLKPTVTRFYLTYGRKMSNDITVYIGYICEASHTSAKHILRLSVFYMGDKRKPKTEE